MNNKLLSIIFMMLFLAGGVGCGGGATEEPVSPTVKPNEEEYLTETFIYEGEEREYILYLPDVYSEEASLPLVVYLHSYGWDSKRGMWNSNFNEIAEKYGFVIVYPNATPNWNSGINDVSSYPTPDTDDVSFIKTLITKMNEMYHIDLEQVYATGYSNGGIMSYRLACEADDQIAAIASVAGGMSESMFENCKPKRAISILEIHGTKDTTLPYTGRPGLKSSEEGIDFWVTANACESTESLKMADIEPEDGSTIEKISHSNCTDGSAVVLMKVVNGGHTWPGEDESTYGRLNKDINASEEIWKFFSGK